MLLMRWVFFLSSTTCSCSIGGMRGKVGDGGREGRVEEQKKMKEEG